MLLISLRSLSRTFSGSASSVASAQAVPSAPRTRPSTSACASAAIARSRKSFRRCPRSATLTAREAHTTPMVSRAPALGDCSSMSSAAMSQSSTVGPKRTFRRDLRSRLSRGRPSAVALEDAQLASTSAKAQMCGSTTSRPTQACAWESTLFTSASSALPRDASSVYSSSGRHDGLSARSMARQKKPMAMTLSTSRVTRGFEVERRPTMPSVSDSALAASSLDTPSSRSLAVRFRHSTLCVHFASLLSSSPSSFTSSFSLSACHPRRCWGALFAARCVRRARGGVCRMLLAWVVVAPAPWLLSAATGAAPAGDTASLRRKLRP
mmetsp:Transcript_39766/g.124213  ORF Transcript_39766/g.124213 Transcript_39766/m.124213 type:complete len:323 (+) Transcript_39766:2942-3910(+)